MTTRTQVAAFVTDALERGETGVIQSAAAWLVSTGRERQAGYLTRDVARELAGRGYLWVRLTTARPLDSDALVTIEKFVRELTGANKLEVTTDVDPSIIGGLRLETPDAQLDATVRTKLATFVQGVSR
jgi:F-type H+-transporting ATPase subunit delta